MTTHSALVVDDDLDVREAITALVEREGFEVRQAGSVAAARAVLAEAPADIVLIDLSLPDGDGMELAKDEVATPAAFVVITGNASIDSAVDALRRGALDYLTKPVDRPRIQSVLAHVARAAALRAEVASLRCELRQLGHFGALIGASKAMQEIYDLIGRVSPTEASVLLLGESGTGKELVAETIHSLSRRKARPFVAVNCGAISPSLIESELFGHERGSFTGAERRRQGFFEQADGGTLFLDEITEMPLELQVKLLRVLESRAVTRVGSSEAVPVDVRLLSASNRDPKQALEAGALREDLLYRLNVFPIHLPPLRERGDDVVVLAEHFLAALNQRDGTAKRWSDAALLRLRELPWPGNVRELRNVVERAAIMADELIGSDRLPVPEGDRAPRYAEADATLRVAVGASIAEVEQQLIVATLERLSGDKRQAAEVLGISLKTLYNRLAVYGAVAARK